MYKLIQKLSLALLLFSSLSAQNVGIGTSTPNSSALLDLTSTEKGLLIPRMTASDKSAISSPATSLMIYQTDGVAGFYYYNGLSWIYMGTSGDWSFDGNTVGSNRSLGTNNNFDLLFETNNTERIRIYSGGNVAVSGNVGIGINNPSYKLDVFGTDYLTARFASPTSPLIKLSGSYNSGNGAEFWQDATGDARININSSINSLYLKANGDVGLGISFPSVPVARLDINNGTSLNPIFLARDNGTEVFRIADGGNVGIGTLNPTSKLEINGQITITGGSPGLGKVLTSNATGLASWETPSGSGGTLDQSYDFGGAGIGRTMFADAGVVNIAGSDGLLVTGTYGSGLSIGSVNGIPEGAGTRMFFNPRKAAFRVGGTAGTHWDNANIGDYSSGIGPSTIASGYCATSIGYLTTASGVSSLALGERTIASGQNSTAMGYLTTASSYTSTALGYQTIASNFYSTAMGIGSIASGEGSTAIGNTTTASGIGSIAMGYVSTASGYCSNAIGWWATASGQKSLALGTLLPITWMALLFLVITQLFYQVQQLQIN